MIAKGAGHFIQRDNPQCVANEIIELIEKVIKDGEYVPPDEGKIDMKRYASG